MLCNSIFIHNYFNTIIAQLEELFIEMDAKVLAETKKWALEREQAIYEFLKSDEAKAMGMKNLQEYGMLQVSYLV